MSYVNWKTPELDYYLETESTLEINPLVSIPKLTDIPTQILFITTFPPRQCGIATYSQDLVNALNNKFNNSFELEICALESKSEVHHYDPKPKFILNTDQHAEFSKLANQINNDQQIKLIVIQHEFGLFDNNEVDFKLFYEALEQPVIFVFHTVLPKPSDSLKFKVKDMAAKAAAMIVMTNNASQILMHDYEINGETIAVIPHGTHLVPHHNKVSLKSEYNLEGRIVLSTFGLISEGKSIETTLDALPAVIVNHPEVLFLIIGKTHPTVEKREGEKYRNYLEKKVVDLGLQKHVLFVNKFLPLQELLTYLQLTDIYLFTSKDRNQAVSGTFSYAISCGCPVISTPIPHASEVLKDDAGIIVDFENSTQLGNAIIHLLHDEQLIKDISSSGLHKMASSAWENSAISHAKLFERICSVPILLDFKLPDVNLHHIKKMTTAFGIIQFANIYQPDLNSGYTLDDNARALIAICQHYQIFKDDADLKLIETYLLFIKGCIQSNGKFLNYIDDNKKFTDQNYETNLEDANGRGIWALGFLISLRDILPADFCEQAENIIEQAIPNLWTIHSTRAMGFIIKGLYYQNSKWNLNLLNELAGRLVQMYRHEQDGEWNWYESYLTYGNSLLPEALLCAYNATGNILYKEVAKTTFDFLLSKIFIKNRLVVISNKGWLQKSAVQDHVLPGGEQPIDVAYTILSLEKFYSVFQNRDYKLKAVTAFSWFLGNNHLSQIIYNPCTGGCYDGLEESNVNLNQGAESSVSYLMARLAMENLLMNKVNSDILFKNAHLATPQLCKTL